MPPPNQDSPTGFAAPHASLWEGGGFAARRRRRESNQRPYFSPPVFCYAKSSPLVRGGQYCGADPEEASCRERVAERREYSISMIAGGNHTLIPNQPPASADPDRRKREADCLPYGGGSKIQKVHDAIGNLPFTPWTDLIYGCYGLQRD